MDCNVIRDILLDERNIGAIVCKENESYNDITYDCLAICDLILSEKRIPIAIGINDAWQIDLFDFYIRGYESFRFIPHISKNGKLCLYDLEGALIDTQFEGLLHQCIDQARTIIYAGLTGENRHDFIKEFYAYWLDLPGVVFAKFEVLERNSFEMLKYIYNIPHRNSRESVSAYQKKLQVVPLYACLEGSKLFQTWKITGTQKNGLYARIKLEDYVYPPDPRYHLSVKYVNDILKLIEKTEIEVMIRKLSRTAALVFDLFQPDGSRVFIGILFENGRVEESSDAFQLSDDTRVRPLIIQRIDTESLQCRTAEMANPLREKRIIIIGCGSIGGYIAEMLVKSGCRQLTLVDNQKMYEENIFRHILGMKYVDQYKTVALYDYLSSNVPDVTIRSVEDTIQNVVIDGSIDLADYDIVVAATGNHNVNRWINKYIIDCNIKTVVVYPWTEPLDIGCHVVVDDYSLEGNYEDLFARDVNGVLFDQSAFCRPDQVITRNLYGCGGSYIPYGSGASIQAASMTIEVIKRYITNRVVQNAIISFKGNGFFFHSAGMRHTEMYEKQLMSYHEENISDLKKRSCNL